MQLDLVALIAFLEEYFNQYGYVIVFFSGFIETTPLGWIFPGNTLIAAGGYFARTGSSSISGIIFSSWIGSWAVFILSYILGASSGEIFIKKLHQERNASRAAKLLKQYGGKILGTSLLAGVIRFWIAYMAGAKNYSKLRFLVYTGLSTFAWVTLWALLGYILGSQEHLINNVFTAIGVFSWVVFIGLGYALFRHTKEEYEEYKEKQE
ncbi:hypothetical protein A2801_01775 [Candidatus Woesebacteria bacterium RIFCSPHIGHO2_01_FULL_41_10]|uniref:VTT domain-containing protein n=1 Tax=Candidatus Woesebacteria bacterium RIFCSPHIGHO2_01_FULL_41_10 TaxID=1802500 RepID=A0A1F7YQ05_9BACT|nr:MAG: hypothetical protein A2801_01775 [Candidatus Woesebacteria bacterium RIFCSPHIGHO2_01_FULL_41_10]